MTGELYDALLEHKKTVKSDWVFPDPESGQACTVAHFMKRLCQRAGVKPFGFHAIRHLSASILAQVNVPIVTIQSILRHKNLHITERYIRGLEPVRPALEALFDRKTRPKVPTKPVDESRKIRKAG